MKPLRQIISDTVFIGFVQVLSVFSSIVSIGVILRFLGIEQYGLLAVYRLFTSKGLLMLSELGLRKPFAREIAAAKESIDRSLLSDLLGGVVFVSFVIGILLSIFLFLLGPLKIISFLNIPLSVQPFFYKILLITFCLIPIEVFGLFSSSVLEGLNEYKVLKGVELVQILVLSAGYILLSLCHFTYQYLIVFLLITNFISSCYKSYIALLLSKSAIETNIGKVLRALRPVLYQAKYYMLATFSSVIGNYSPNFIMSVMFSPSYVGYADIVQKLPRIIKNSFGFIGQNLMVVTSERNAIGDRKFISALFNKGIKLYQFILIPISCVFSVYNQYVMKLWVGEDIASYLSGYAFWAILSIAFFPIASFGWNFLSGYAVKLNKMALFQWIVTTTKIIFLICLSPFIGIGSVVLALWAFVIVLPFNISYYNKYLELDIKDYWFSVSIILISSLGISYVTYAIDLLLSDGVFWVAAFLFALISSYIINFFLYLKQKEREDVVKLINMIKLRLLSK